MFKFNVLKDFNKYIRHFKRKYKYIYHFLTYDILIKAFSDYMKVKEKIGKNSIFKKYDIIYFYKLSNALFNDNIGNKMELNKK